MGRNLTDLYISESFNHLLQISGSDVQNGLGVNITGSLTNPINITVASASYAVSASHEIIKEVSSSYADFAESSSYASKANQADFIKAEFNGGPSDTYLLAFEVENGINDAKTVGLVYNPFGETLSSTGDDLKISGSLIGNASTATSATTATSASHATYAESAGAVAFNNITGKPTLVSGSAQIDVSATTGNLPAARVSGTVATATSASHAIQADSATTATTATNATYAQNTTVTGKNVTGTLIAKGTPLYFTGSGTEGNLVGVIPADASNPSLMPAGGIAGEAIASGAEGVVLLDGFINGVDTSAFSAGDEVYVAVGGGYTNVAPTGSANLVQKLGNVEKVDASNGSGVINGPGAVRALPNLTQDYVWKGDANGVPQAVDQTTLNVNSAQSADTANTATTASYALVAQTLIGSVVSASYAATSSIVEDPNVAYRNQNNTFSGLNTFTGASNIDGTSMTLESDASLILKEGPGGAGASSIIFYSGSNPGASYLSLQPQPSGNGNVVMTDSTDNSKFVIFNPTAGKTSFPKPIAGGANADSALSISNGAQITGSLNGSGSVQLIVPSPGVNSETHFIEDSANFTNGWGAAYDAPWLGKQNYPAAYPYQNAYSIAYNDAALTYAYYTELLVGPNRTHFQLKPSGSGGISNIAVQSSDGSQTLATIYADETQIGAFRGNVLMGKAGQTVTISGSVNVAETINGTITNATSASFASTATSASHATSIGVLNQDVDINGNLEVVGNTSLTGSYIGSGSFKQNVPAVASGAEVHYFELPNVTGNYGQQYLTPWFGVQNYPAFGQYNDAFTVQYVDPGFSFLWYAEALFGPERMHFNMRPSGSGQTANIGVQTGDDGAGNKFSLANIYGDKVDVGLFRGNVFIGNDSGTVQISGSVSVKNTIDGTITNANTASYVAGANVDGTVANATSASYAANAGQWDGNYEGTARISGSLLTTGSFNAKVNVPGTNSEVHYLDLPSVTTTATTNPVTYGNNYFGIQNYPVVSNQYEQAFTQTFVDPAVSYAYFSEAIVGPQRGGFMIQPSGSGALANVSVASNAEQTRTFSVIYGDEVQLGVFKGDTITIGAVANNPTVNIQSAQTKITGSVNVNGSLTVTGSIANKVTTLQEGPSTYWVMDLNSGSYFDVAMVSGSQVFVQTANLKPGQTFTLKTTQPTSSADSYGTIQFDGNFKFSGGTAPTATQATGSVDIYTFVSYDSSTVYATQVTDLK